MTVLVSFTESFTHYSSIATKLVRMSQQRKAANHLCMSLTTSRARAVWSGLLSFCAGSELDQVAAGGPADLCGLSLQAAARGVQRGWRRGRERGRERVQGGNKLLLFPGKVNPAVYVRTKTVEHRPELLCYIQNTIIGL